ncbi:MAG: hypothetical protein IPL24_05910 [Bacteroidetes bacterium]|nr:hypothetical protein [Bacteroidota bacterium]
MSLREMASAIGLRDESPQKIKHHLQQLEKRGFLSIDRGRGPDRSEPSLGWAKNSRIYRKHFSNPILGTANCGPAIIFLKKKSGLLRVSTKLVGRSQPDGLYAIKADGSSMNREEINGKRIEDGDYVIINANDKNVYSKDVVLYNYRRKGYYKAIYK